MKPNFHSGRTRKLFSPVQRQSEALFCIHLQAPPTPCLSRHAGHASISGRGPGRSAEGASSLHSQGFVTKVVALMKFLMVSKFHDKLFLPNLCPFLGKRNKFES